MQTIAVIDYGMGNLHSVGKALEHVGSTRVQITSDPQVIRDADRVVLPGVGAMRDCMAEMQRFELLDVIREVSQDRPFLGICVGMQALLDSSEENGGVPCLGLFPGQVRYFGQNLQIDGERLKVPHMGWNTVEQRLDHPLWHNIPDQSRFYFVHSYHVVPAEADLALGTTDYGTRFVSAIARDNVSAVQFHPEKSAAAGLRLLRNFLHWNP